MTTAKVLTIASLSINAKSVMEESVKVKKEIDEIKKKQKELDKTTDEGIATSIRNETQLKTLQKTYRDNQKVLIALDESEKELVKTMSIEGKSTKQLRDDRAKLNQISQNIKGTTIAEIEQRNKLNIAMDKQSEQIKKQSPGYVKLKDNIGNYEGATNKLMAGMQKMTGRLKTSFKSFGASLKANPIFMIIAILTAVVGFMQKLLKPFQPLLDWISDKISYVQGIIEGLMNSLSAIGSAISSFFGGDIEKAGEQIREVRRNIQELADATENYNKVTREQDIIAKENDLTTSESMQHQKELERILRDTTKTTKERSEALEELRKIQKDQAQDDVNEKTERYDALMRKINAKLKVQKKGIEDITKVRSEDLAELRLSGKLTDDIYADIIKARKEVAKVNEKSAQVDVTLQRYETQVKRQALKDQKKAEQEAQKWRDEIRKKRANAVKKAIQDQQKELTYYIASQGKKARTLEQDLQLATEVSEKKIKILDAELKAKQISQIEYDTNRLNIENALLEKQTLLAIDNAKRELENYKNVNQSKINDEIFLNDEMIMLEVERLNNIAEKEKEFAKIQLENGKLNQQQYNDAIRNINNQNAENVNQLKLKQLDDEKNRKIIDAENDLKLLEEQGGHELEIRQAQLDAEYRAEIEKAKKTGADKAKIEALYAKRKEKLDNDTRDAQIAGMGDVFNSYSEILGKQTVAGKAFAIASTIISTYQSAQNAYKSLSEIPVIGVGLGIAAATSAIIAGTKRVNKIRSTPTKFSKGDILSGASHVNGGIPFAIGRTLGFEAEGGEAIINKKSTSMFAPILSAINVAGGGKKFASGGLISSSMNSNSLINYDLIAEKVSEANRNIPAPVVSVAEINTVSDNVKVVENLASS